MHSSIAPKAIIMRFDDQTLSDSNVFVAVVRCGSFAKAARSLDLLVAESQTARKVDRWWCASMPVNIGLGLRLRPG